MRMAYHRPTPSVPYWSITSPHLSENTRAKLKRVEEEFGPRKMRSDGGVRKPRVTSSRFNVLS